MWLGAVACSDAGADGDSDGDMSNGNPQWCRKSPPYIKQNKRVNCHICAKLNTPYRAMRF